MAKENSEEKKATGKSKAKSPGQLLADKLLFKLKNAWEGVDKKTENEIEAFSRSYRAMLDLGKTEREFSSVAAEQLRKQGFKEIDRSKNTSYSPGEKVYEHIRGKALVAAVIGRKPLEAGVNILGAHIDSPRIDLKPNPVYEDNEFALLDTHYYGGVKKYQWTVMPLAMHGVFIDPKGKKINISIGENDDDPVFTITDLLPHLAQDQIQKKASEVVEGEDLDILAGSRPYEDEEIGRASCRERV